MQESDQIGMSCGKGTHGQLILNDDGLGLSKHRANMRCLLSAIQAFKSIRCALSGGLSLAQEHVCGSVQGVTGAVVF